MKELEWKMQDLKQELERLSKRRKELLKYLKALEWAIKQDPNKNIVQ